jgi:hypothetical protein
MFAPGAEQGRPKRGTNARGLSLVASVLPRTFCWPNQALVSTIGVTDSRGKQI